ncbi:unnamed protein product [Mytilus edulis]|uniref:Uncharacterized protein n=1 Tax=Mytilus edulis TaxID=6550 RepID=A0A8S3VM42_MYTED|nr:unnamed protein product [Mytilus edulis]
MLCASRNTNIDLVESYTDHYNVIMLEEICIIFITILACSLAFNLSCPGSGQWNYRAVLYCSDLNKYTCLLDTSKTRYTETCDGSRKETEGYKSTINRNNFDTAKCRPDRFQPKDFITVGHSDCVFQKSKCAQEGQIAAHEIKEKTSLLDTKCLCDYTKGYSFINSPKDKCYCSPLVDDCSCFREVCASGKILSPDYQCTTPIDMKNRKWNCSKIASAEDSQNGDQVQQSIKDIDTKNERQYRIAVQVIVPILVSIMTVYEKDDDNESETQHSPEKNDKIQHELSRQRDSKTSVHDISSSQEELKYNQIDGRKTDQISQTKQSDSSSSEDDDESFKSTHSSMTGLNKSEDKNRVTNNSTAFEKHHSDKGDDTVDKSSTVEKNDEMIKEYKQLDTTTKDIGDITEESDETNCMVEAVENKIKKNEEFSTFAKEQKDKIDDPVEETGTVVAEIEKTSEEDNTDHSDESDAKKSDTENKKPSEQDNTDHSDRSDAKKSETDNKPSEEDSSDHSDESAANKSDTENKKPSEQDNTDHSDRSDAKKSETDNKPSEQDNTDHSDRSDAKKSETDNKPSEEDSSDHSDESAANKSDTENKKPSEQDNTDHSDRSDAKKSETDNKLNELKLETEDADKIVKTGDPDKIVKMEDPDKTVKTEDPDKIVKTEDPDKIVKTEDPDKTVKTEDPDKTVKTEDPDKTVKTEDPDKTVKTEDPDKTVKTEDPDNIVKTENPDKSTPVATEKCFASLLDDFKIKNKTLVKPSTEENKRIEMRYLSEIIFQSTL